MKFLRRSGLRGDVACDGSYSQSAAQTSPGCRASQSNHQYNSADYVAVKRKACTKISSRIFRDDEETNNTHAILAASRHVRETTGRCISIAEYGELDNVFARIGNYDYTNFRLKMPCGTCHQLDLTGAFANCGGVPRLFQPAPNHRTEGLNCNACQAGRRDATAPQPLITMARGI
jgi:hypothetical protein